MIHKVSPIIIGLFFILISVNYASAIEAPRLTLDTIIGLLIDQSEDLQKNLLSLKGLNEEQEKTRQDLLISIDEMLDYYESLEIAADGSNVKNLATELKNRRDNVYNPIIKEAGEFVLVFQAKGLLKTANNRFIKINFDLDRLIDLKILDRNKPQFLLNEAHLLLVGAESLVGQAQNLLATTSEARSEIRDLISTSVGKIKLAYKKFFDISNLLKEALK